mgnify:CR=1 FL=1
MAAPAGAYVIRDCTITVEGTDYANQVTKARLVPETPIQTLRTLVPDGIVQDVDSSSWTLELAGIQDWVNAQGLADALNDNKGLEVDIVLTPRNGTGKPKATFVAIAMPVPFGGEQGQFATFDVTLPVVGQPTFGTVA